MPTRTRLLLAFGWLGVQLVAWRLASGGATRAGIAVVSTLALPVAVVLFRPFPRRSR